jgi:hypothetical protein
MKTSLGLLCLALCASPAYAQGIATEMSPTATPQPRRAQQPSSPHPSKTPSRVRATFLFLTGAASGLVIHESGHIMFGAAFGAHPRVRALEGSAIPFFKIEHNPVTRRQEFVISSAGLWMQYADSEWMLTARPHLRDEHAPFLKGMLAFDLATSTMYSVAAFGRLGPSERDTRGIAASLGKNGAPEPVVGLMVLAPAVLDGYRFLRPEAAWAKWASRSVKVLSVVLTIAAGK